MNDRIHHVSVFSLAALQLNTSPDDRPSETERTAGQGWKQEMGWRMDGRFEIPGQMCTWEMI